MNGAEFDCCLSIYSTTSCHSSTGRIDEESVRETGSGEHNLFSLLLSPSLRRVIFVRLLFAPLVVVETFLAHLGHLWWWW